MFDILFFVGLFLLGVFGWYRFSLVLLSFPFLFLTYFWSVEVFGVPVNFLEGATYVLFLLWLRVLYQRRQERKTLWFRVKSLFFSLLSPFLPERRRFREWIFCTPLGPLAVFFVACTITLFFTPTELRFHTGIPSALYEVFPTLRIALGIYKAWIIAPLLYVLVLFFEVRREEEWHHLLLSYVWASVLLSAFSLLSALFSPVDRLVGPFLSPNYLALFITPACFFLLIHVLREAFLNKRWKEDPKFSLEILLLIVVMGALVLTKTYAAFLALGLVTFFSLFFLFSGKSRIVAIGAFVLTCVLGLLALLPTEKFQRFFDTKGDSSTSVRLEVYDISLGLIQEHPVTGIGLGQFEAQYKLNAHRLLGYIPRDWVMLHPHNLYLSFWLFSGLLGVLSFVWLLWMLIVGSLRRLSVVWFSFGLLLLPLIHGFFDTPFWKNDLIYLFWTLVFYSFFCSYTLISRKGKKDADL